MKWGEAGREGIAVPDPALTQQCLKGLEPSLQTTPSAQTLSCVPRLACKHLLAWVALTAEWALTVAQCDPHRSHLRTMQAQGGLHIHRPELQSYFDSFKRLTGLVQGEGPKLILAFLLAGSGHHRAKDSTRVHFLTFVLPSKRTACINESPCLALSSPNCLSERVD